VDKVEELKITFDRKALWINIDGATGRAVKEIMPPNIAKILPHSKYSFEGMSDSRILTAARAEDPVTWTTMLTGVIPDKHFVRDLSYLPDVAIDVDHPNTTLTYYPNVFHFINESLPGAKIVCITPWTNLNNNMLNNTYKTITSTSGEDAKNQALRYLGGEEENDIALTLVDFNDMLEPGKADGFVSSNTAYAEALRAIDSYIGEMLDAIENRENYDNEDWLVIITSNHGGDAAGNFAGNTIEERNIFGIFYFPHYEEYQMQGAFLYAAYFPTGGIQAIAIDSMQYYSMGENKTLSAEFVMRMNPKQDGTYGGSTWDRIMGKKSWGLNRQRSTISARIEQGIGSAPIEKAVTSFNDPLWHVYFFGTEATDVTAKNFKIFYNGVKNTEGNSLTAGPATDSSNFVVQNNAPTSFHLAEIRLWNIMLSDESVITNSSTLNIQPSHPDYSHLVGYWKFDPDDPKTVITADTAYLENQIEGREALAFTERPVFAVFPNTLPKYLEEGNPVIENTHIVPQILYWLRAASPTTLDGVLFLDKYSNDENWRETIDE
jgi:hypothetical protein